MDDLNCTNNDEQYSSNINQIMQKNGDPQNINLLDNNNLKNFSYTPTMTPNKSLSNPYSLYGKQGHFNLNEALIPLEQLVSMFNDQDKAGILSTLPLALVQGKDKDEAGSSK